MGTVKMEGNMPSNLQYRELDRTNPEIRAGRTLKMAAWLVQVALSDSAIPAMVAMIICYCKPLESDYIIAL